MLEAQVASNYKLALSGLIAVILLVLSQIIYPSNIINSR